jgi:GNAT superfamily N-acetyltransferase
MNTDILIRPFTAGDREAVRRISCQTAFLGLPVQDFIDDEEIVADALTLYYTDYEPGSCFVAVDRGNVIGYIIGSRNLSAASKIAHRKIIVLIFQKLIRKYLFFRKNTIRFLFRVLKSALRGEFFAPDFSKAYPATLHINIDKDFRGEQVGSRLIETYINFLRGHHVSGVHFGTVSERAKDFFLKNGFQILFKQRRSYLSDYTGKPVMFYIFGKKLI